MKKKRIILPAAMGLLALLLVVIVAAAAGRAAAGGEASPTETARENAARSVAGSGEDAAAEDGGEAAGETAGFVYIDAKAALPEIAADAERVCYIANEDTGGASAVYLQTELGILRLFLPSCADPERLALHFSAKRAIASGSLGSWEIESGVPFSLAGLAERNENGTYNLTLTLDGIATEISVLFSANARSLYLTSGDPERGRAWVEQSRENKNNKAEGGAAVLLRPDGSAAYAGALKSIKGRGNSTWRLYPKKPYQFKLRAAADLLETGEPAKAGTAWVLLANYLDDSLLRNTVTLDLAAAFGVAWTPRSVPVDLYYDGEYRGSYLLCEKLEVGPGRVDIRDLEAEIAALNPGLDDAAPETAVHRDGAGNAYSYVPDLVMPEDISGGYLLELDYGDRAQEEACWFRTANKNYLAFKSPEYVSAEAAEYVSALFRRFEAAIYNGGTDPETGLDYTEFMDLDSLVRCYLLMELAADNDAFLSSTFFFKPAGEEKLYAGPVWDFDTAFGNSNSNSKGTVAGASPIGKRLLAIPSFRQRLAELYPELYDLVAYTLLGGGMDARSGPLRSLASYEAEIAGSRAMDGMIWLPSGLTDPPELADCIAERAEWLRKQAESWAGNALS